MGWGLTKRRRADGPNDGSVWPDHPSSGPSARRLLVRLAERRADGPDDGPGDMREMPKWSLLVLDMYLTTDLQFTGQ